MAAYVTAQTKWRLVRFTESKFGDEEEQGDWYDGQHMQKVASTEAWIASDDKYKNHLDETPRQSRRSTRLAAPRAFFVAGANNQSKSS